MEESEELEKSGNLARNERLKLTATYLNGLAIAVFAVGGLAPIASVLANDTPPKTLVLGLIVICFPLSLVLHFTGRLWLRELKE